MKVLFQNKTIILTSSPYGAPAGGLLICILYLVLLAFLAPALKLPLDSWAFFGLALPGLLIGVFFLRSITLTQSNSHRDPEGQFPYRHSLPVSL